MKISEIKTYILSPMTTRFQAFNLLSFFRDEAGSVKNKRIQKSFESKSERVKKYGVTRWGEKWYE